MSLSGFSIRAILALFWRHLEFFERIFHSEYPPLAILPKDYMFIWDPGSRALPLAQTWTCI